MKILFFICLLALLFSCNNNKIKEDNRNQNEREKVQPTDSLHSDSKTNLNSYPLDGKFPFGYVYLENIDTSLDWDSLKLESNFDKIYNYYKSLNRLKTISKVDISDTTYINLQYGQPFNRNSFIDSITISLDSIRYKLENIGPYECYYTQLNDDSVRYPPNFYDDERLCRSSGNLIFYDPLSRLAKVITIYNIITQPYETEYRFFFINKNKEIKIFTAQSNEGELSIFYQSYSIKVLDNGEIKIKELKPPIN
jgi:hypothetical protein